MCCTVILLLAHPNSLIPNPNNILIQTENIMTSFKNQNPNPNNLLHNKLIHGFVSFLAFSMISPATEAQSSPPENQVYNPRFSPSMGVIIIILIASLFCMAFFSLYLRHCSQTPSGQSIRQTLSIRRRAAAARGLDEEVIGTFPTFSYAEVKDKRIGKGALECAVCLNEFEDDETLRLIPNCDHVFHPECIDAWLHSHVTCPVCRANLSPTEDQAAPPLPPSLAPPGEANPIVEEQTGNEEVLVRVERGEEHESTGPEVEKPGLNRVVRSWSIKKPKMFSFGKYRSHSTGHSLVLAGENLDRFTLRLPEEVRKEMLNRAFLNRNESCVRRFEGGEGSSRGGSRTGGGRLMNRRIDIPDRGARSDRWAFLSRALSMKSPKVIDNGSGSTSKSPRPMVKLPSFNCLEPRSSDEIETGLVRSDSARQRV